MTTIELGDHTVSGMSHCNVAGNNTLDSTFPTRLLLMRAWDTMQGVEEGAVEEERAGAGEGFDGPKAPQFIGVEQATLGARMHMQSGSQSGTDWFSRNHQLQRVYR
jgi:hypothetical protein